MINQRDKRFMVYSKTIACACERLSSHSSRDFWLRCWKDRSSGIYSKLHASRVTILEFLAKISCNSRENSRVIPASSTQNPCEFWGFVAWKNWNIHAGYLKIRSFPTMVLYDLHLFNYILLFLIFQPSYGPWFTYKMCFCQISSK